MEKNRISICVLFTISIVLLLITNSITYVMLLSKKEELWTILSMDDKGGIDVTMVMEALTEHVYYDGDSIPCNQTVRHYSRLGKMLGYENLSEVLKGDRVVLLLSPNCCSSCAKDEIEKLLELSRKIGRRRLVLIADFAIHMYPSWTKYFDNEGYFETDTGHLGIEGSPTQETPVVMLTQNGRIKTSFIVRNLTNVFVDRFHEYMIEYFKKEEII